MQYSVAFLSLLPAVLATTYRIDVGADGELEYSPNRVDALPGDIIEFLYHPKNHSVTQSSFAAPCVPLANGINSGFVPVNSSDDTTTAPQHFSIQVNDTKPLWFYCAQGKHCEAGMSMVINEPSGMNTLDAYQKAAENATTKVNPMSPVGGNFTSDEASNSSTTHSPWSTYTTAYSTYSTSANGIPTTVTLQETVTTLPTASGSGASASPTNAAARVGSAGWAAAVGAAVFGGLMI